MVVSVRRIALGLLVSMFVALSVPVAWAGSDCAGSDFGVPCDSDNNECTRDICDGGGNCVHENVPFGSPCDSDGNTCTDDFCDPGGLCVHQNLPFQTPCDSDANECTHDFCDPGGLCLHQNVPFESPCNSDDNTCTHDFCDPSGLCVHQNVPFQTPCDSDGNTCTDDFCDFSGLCVHQNQPFQTPCEDDGNPCTSDVCDPGGACVHLGPETCSGTCTGAVEGTACADDGNECTADTCSSGICQHFNLQTNSPCDSDGNECTRDTCDGAGACLHFNLAGNTPCDDEDNECTRDTCSGSGACVHQNLPGNMPCDSDANACTRDTCNGSGACSNQNLSSNTPCESDSNDCTRDRCNGSGTCISFTLTNSTPCPDDVDACTTEQCVTGVCQHAPVAGCVTPPQTKTQQKCLVALNKSTSVLFKALSKASLSCIGNALKGKETSPQACLGADPKGKVTDAKDKVTATADKLCSLGAIPDFGPSSAATIIATVEAQRLALVSDMFGSDLDDPLLPPDEKARTKCQADVSKAATSLASAELKAFNKCKKVGIKSEIVSRLGIDACLENVGADVLTPDTKLGKAAAKLAAASADCAVSDIDEAFPGSCDGAETPDAFEGCLLQSVQCRVCKILDQIDDLGVPCDLFDDGDANQSCVGQ